MTQKKILYLSRGGDIEGSQRQLLYLLGDLDRNLYDPLVIYTSPGGFADALRQMQIDSSCWPLRSYRKLKYFLWRYIDVNRLTRYGAENRVSVVHCSDLWLSGYMHWVAKLLKIPSVLHVRTPISCRDVRKHKCARADLVIAISARIVRNLMEAGINPERIVQADDGTDSEIFKPRHSNDRFRRRLRAGADTVVGIVGRIDKSKRQLEFLKAAQIVSKSHSAKVRFLIVGPPHSQHYYSKLKEYVGLDGLSDKVSFTGYCNDMPRVLSSLDILVSLSGGSVMFEAMACATPVISAGFTSPKDAVHITNERTGLLVPSRSTADLAKAMSRLLEDRQLRAKIGQNARDWALRNLSHHRMAGTIHTAYARLLKGRSLPSTPSFAEDLSSDRDAFR